MTSSYHLRGAVLDGDRGLDPLLSPSSDFGDFLEAEEETREYRGMVLAAAVRIVLRETGMTHYRLCIRLHISHTGLTRWRCGAPMGETWFNRALASLARVRHGIN